MRERVVLPSPLPLEAQQREVDRCERELARARANLARMTDPLHGLLPGQARVWNRKVYFKGTDAAADMVAELVD